MTVVSLILEIPTINDKPQDFDCLCQLWQKVQAENDDLPADKALEWAFQKGTTTRGGEVVGGIGLDCLKQFVHINKGKLQILSHDGCATIDKNGEVYENKQTFFGGTLVNIKLLCDESYYSLDFEADDEPLF